MIRRRVGVGRLTPRASASHSPPVADERAPFRLVAKLPSGEEAGAAIAPGAPVVVGRAMDCPLVLAGDGRASRHHAALEVRGDEVWVRDLKSRNGVLLNGTRVEEARVAVGDTLQVGNSWLRVELQAGGTTLLELRTCAACGRPLPATLAAGEAPRCERCAEAGDAARPALPGYAFERRLGAGAMGDVWLAKDRRGERVAVKILAPPRGAKPVPGALARFVREANALRTLCHPGIVLLLEAGVADEVHYIVMEYVAGEDYDHRLERMGRVPLPEVCRLVLEMCGALGHAHAQGVVHRDVKPGNILVATGDGRRETSEDAHAGRQTPVASRVKLTDFGLARMAQQSGLSVQSMSAAGIGSPLYMPPEQVLAIHKADHRADLYALAATAFHLAAGQPVFAAPSVAEIVTRLLDEPAPSLASVLPGAPASLAQALAWALEKDPDRRYQSAEDMAQAWKSAMKSAGIPAGT